MTTKKTKVVWIKTKYPSVRYKVNAQGVKVYYGRIGQKGYLLGHDLKPKEASDKLSQIRLGNNVPAKDYPDFNNGWLKFGNIWDDNKDSRKKDLAGFKSDNYAWNKYISPLFGERKVDSLKKAEIDNFKATLSEKYKLAPATRKQILQLLTKAAKALDHNLKIKMPKINNVKIDKPKSKIHYYTFVEFLKGYTTTPVSQMMLLALYSGLRRGEICRLRWDDVDFNRSLLYIGEEQKNGERSNIPLNSLAIDIIKAQPKTSEFVFTGTKGGKRYDRAVGLTAKRIATKFGLPEDFRAFHSLRHWFASNMASSGKVDQYLLQHLLRHKSPEMTARYSHLSNEAFDRAKDVGTEVL